MPAPHFRPAPAPHYLPPQPLPTSTRYPMRRALLAAALATLPAAGAAAQAERGVLAAYGTGGGSTETTEPRFTLHAAYVAGGTGPTGAYAGIRYAVGLHVLRADPAEHLARAGVEEGAVAGGAGTLLDTGADVEVGWKLGPLRPYWFTGYHYYRQTVDPATVTADGTRTEVEGERAAAFARSRGYGAVLLLSGSSGLFAERYRGAGRGGVMQVSGTRFGIRLAR
jgi:hypothetical protein